MTPVRWFYIREGSRLGPTDLDQLVELIVASEIPADALVWRQGLAGWTPAAQVSEIAERIPPPLPGARAEPEARPESPQPIPADLSPLAGKSRLLAHLAEQDNEANQPSLVNLPNDQQELRTPPSVDAKEPRSAAAVALRWFGRLWLALGFLLITLGYIGVLLRDGWSGLFTLLSPFNVWNYLAVMLTLAPGIWALDRADKVQDRRNRDARPAGPAVPVGPGFPGTGSDHELEADGPSWLPSLFFVALTFVVVAILLIGSGRHCPARDTPPPCADEVFCTRHRQHSELTGHKRRGGEWYGVYEHTAHEWDGSQPEPGVLECQIEIRCRATDQAGQ